MKAIDNTIKYYELIMKYEDTDYYDKYFLPDGYHYEFYKDGDIDDWINIHLESGEFTSVSRGYEIFHDFYDSFIGDLDKRCVFVVDDKSGEKIGTATVSLLKKAEYDCFAAVDWVAIKKNYQGKGLARPLISEVLTIAKKNLHKQIILHTQTTTWLAAKLYLDFGFIPVNLEEVVGWGILKELTNHDSLKDIEAVSEIYDLRNVEIERQLSLIYSSEFQFEVWYRNGLHNVYVYSNGVSDEYEYFINGKQIRLEKVYK